MDTIFSLFPDADELLKMQPEDLAPVLLRLALPQLQSAGFIPLAVTQVSAGDAVAGRDYPFHKKRAVDQMVNRAWNWIEREGFIETAEGINGQNGWRLFTEKGERIARGEDIQKLRAALAFPKWLLHPAIREASFRAVMRSANATSANDLADAVRAAFVAVEDAVRQAGGYKPKEFGESLMKAAFDPDTGPMGDRDTSKPKAEREGLKTLFIGAMNAYRNPVSHRALQIELEEAKDQLLLASHLLRIVDARRPLAKP
jgi:uncharacterized protein (TIGR02391 family)